MRVMGTTGGYRQDGLEKTGKQLLIFTNQTNVKTMRILIVEDETTSAKRLKRLILQLFSDKPCPEVSHVESLEAALSLLERKKIDLLFLDLNLNGQNGFEILKHVVSQSFHTIIVSAYGEKAIEAFEYGVLDFIVKPVMPERLNKAINRFYFPDRSQNYTEFLTVRKMGSLELIPVSQIKYIQAVKHYSELYLENGNKRFHDKSLEKLYCTLPEFFERIHKSYIVNLEFVKEFQSRTGSRYQVKLKDDSILPVGRTRVEKIREKLVGGE